MYYINYYFKNIQYDKNYYSGTFEAPDYDVVCEFRYNRNTKDIEIWGNNKSIDEILPLPIHWLDMKLEKNGKLNTNECKISY